MSNPEQQKQIEEARAKINEWLFALGEASQYAIEQSDRASYDAIQESKDVYDTVLWALSLAENIYCKGNQ